MSIIFFCVVYYVWLSHGCFTKGQNLSSSKMAKSLRSKWRRKCLRIKRVRYGKKELTRLMAVVEKAKSEVQIKDAAEVVKAMGKENAKSLDEEMQVTPSEESEAQATPASTSLRALLKKNVIPPRWMHQRKAKKMRRQQANKAKRIKKQ
ncbi:protein LLP homolog isoform X2 [Cherax quadricarinatus]